jgi:hypothetical protein
MRLVLLILIAIGGLSARAQGDKQASFPDAYLGVYKGTLHINSPRGTNELPMEFHLLPTKMEGEYYYTLVYGAGADRQERKYRLVEKDREKGLYVVDEDNGIVLDDKVVGNRMYSLFEVMGNLLTTFITFNEDHMVFEIVVSNRKEVNITHATADSTEVSSYPISTVQRAVLQKQQ